MYFTRVLPILMYVCIYVCILITALHNVMSCAAVSTVLEREMIHQKPLNTLMQDWLVLVKLFANSGHKAPIYVRSDAQNYQNDMYRFSIAESSLGLLDDARHMLPSLAQRGKRTPAHATNPKPPGNLSKELRQKFVYPSTQDVSNLVDKQLMICYRTRHKGHTNDGAIGTLT